MTVKELITILGDFDPNTEVQSDDDMIDYVASNFDSTKVITLNVNLIIEK